jgi:hypothetical protein
MLGHMQQGNPTMGFNRYGDANNNTDKYTDPDDRYMPRLHLELVDIALLTQTHFGPAAG